MSHKIKTSVEVDGSLSASQIANATTDTDKFLVSDNGLVKYRTGDELISDLGITLDTASRLRHRVKASVAINKGQAVYAIPTQDGTNILVGLASNATEATSSKTMGLLDATVAINGFANVVTEGLIDGLNTSMANAGDSVWLGTGGNLIYGLSNKPSAPDHLVFIGIVTRVNANNGEIFVKVQNGFELNEIHDVDLKSTTPSGNDILAFEGAPVNLWKNKTIPSVLGYTPVPTTRTITINGSTQDLSANRIFSIDTGVTSFNTRTGAITLSSGDVTGALGYTPYNASNPAGYISSYTETDPTVPSHVKAITTTNISNWNTAFGWGNHASAGYVPGARTITINGTTQDLSANRSFTVTAVEVDTLATVTARGATTSTALNLNGNVNFFSQLAVENQSTFARLAFNRLTFWDWQNGGDMLVLDNNFVQASDSFRAPIFYDSNDTGYYLDPNNTTRIWKIWSGLPNGNGFSPRWDTSFYVMQSQHWYSHTGSQTMYLGESGDHVLIRGYSTADGSFRSPIFYDSNDTGFYLDPASTGLALRLNGNIEVFARSASWAEGVRVRVPGTNVWGGFRTTRDRGNNDGNWYFGYVGFDSSDDFVFGTNNNGVQIDNVLRLSKTGNVFAQGDVTAFYSDERLKERKGNIKNALDKILSLNGFYYINNEIAKANGYVHEKMQIGLSAQEVKSIAPEIVTLAPFDMNTLEDGTVVSKSGKDYLTVNYAKVVPILVEAIKEQQQQIEELKQLIKNK